MNNPKEYNHTIYRGDVITLSFQKVVSSDISSHAFQYVAKADKGLTSDRLIQKENTASGGDSSEMVVSYDSTSKILSVSVYLLAVDTSDLTNSYLYHDILDENTGVSEFSGKLNFVLDVQTPTDNSNLALTTFRAHDLSKLNLEVALIPTKYYEASVGSDGSLIGSAVENNLDGTITIAKDSTGVYSITSSDSEFVNGKTSISLKFPTTFGEWTYEFRSTALIYVRHRDNDGALADDKFIIQIGVFS